jgi:uncharacterized protein (DUF924 family)
MFFYLPFEHSEKLADQERCIALMRTTGDADLVKWAQVHADIIRRFGCFPIATQCSAVPPRPKSRLSSMPAASRVDYLRQAGQRSRVAA